MSKVDEIAKYWDGIKAYQLCVNDIKHEVDWLIDRCRKLEKMAEVSKNLLIVQEKSMGLMGWLGEVACALSDWKKALKQLDEE